MSERHEGLRRGVHAMVLAVGAGAAQLRLPAQAVPGDDGEQLGLGTPEFQWKEIAPVAVRRSTKEVTLLVPADVMETAMGVQGVGAVRAAMGAACAAVVGDEALLLTAVEAVEVGSAICLYRLVLRPQGEEVR